MTPESWLGGGTGSWCPRQPENAGGAQVWYMLMSAWDVERLVECPRETVQDAK